MSALRVITTFFMVLMIAGTASAASLLKAGDIVGVTVAGEEDLTRTYTIDEAGNITLPQDMGVIKMAGLSLTQAQDAIANSLREFMKDPDVRVEMAKQKGSNITVKGAVKTPGTWDITSEIGALDSLSLAGGPQETADLAQVTIVRGGEIIKIDLNKVQADPSKDIKLQDGDVVTVANRVIGTFTVLGAANTVGPFPLLRGAKLIDAIRLAGGPKTDVKIEGVKIIREDGTTEKADLMKLMYQGAVEENKPIYNGDTIVLETEFAGGATITVMGSVLSPGPKPLGQKMTITQAIGLAGGFAPSAKQEDVILYREQKPTKINFKKIFEGDATADVLVQEGDVINVPDKGPAKPGALDTILRFSPFFFLL